MGGRRRPARAGKTILLTTHYMEEAERLADRIVVMARGEVVAEGAAATLGGRDRAGRGRHVLAAARHAAAPRWARPTSAARVLRSSGTPRICRR